MTKEKNGRLTWKNIGYGAVALLITLIAYIYTSDISELKETKLDKIEFHLGMESVNEKLDKSEMKQEKMTELLIEIDKRVK